MKLKELLSDCFNMQEEEFRDEQVIMEMEDWDSMNHMIFITKLEEEYEIDLNGDEIAAIKTVGDIKSLLNQRGKTA